MKIRQQAMAVLVVVLVTAWTLTGCGGKEAGWSEKNVMVLGTHSQIRVHSEDRESGAETVDRAFQRVREIEDRMSTWEPDSQIARINRQAGREPVQVTDDVLFMIEEGLLQYELTNGLFHIGLGTLTELWGLSSDQPRIPEPDEIERAVERIDIQTIHISGNQVKILQPGTAIDLGGIAKGYAVDESARILRDNGISSGIINFGGDVYALGEKPDGAPWYVGIKEPVPGTNELLGRLGVKNLAVVTSGDYERYVADDDSDTRFHHILDPRTGMPAVNELVSTTIIADTALEADIVSTAVFVMGLESGYRYTLELPNVEGIFVTGDNEVYLTPGVINLFELRNSDYLLMGELEVEDE